MFDLEKLAKSILVIISEPINRLADKIKAIEDRNKNTFDGILLFHSETENVAKALAERLDQIEKAPLLASGIDPNQLFTREQVKQLVDEFLSKVTEQVSSVKKLIHDIPPVDIDAIVDTVVSRVPTPKDGEDGKSVTQDDIDAIVNRVVASIPKPKDGEDGKSVTEDDINKIIEKVTSAIPTPKDGEDGVTFEECKDFIVITIKDAVAGLPKPKDGKNGVGASNALINRDGNLVLVMSDGTSFDLGPVIGKDGIDADMEAIEKSIAEKIAAIPPAKDGIDGVGIDDLSVEFDGKRTFTFRFANQQKTKEFSFKIPHMIYHDVYKEGKSYEKGDVVTWGGSMWHCNKDTTGKPRDSADWTLAVKHGRDAKPIVKKD